MNKAKIFKYSVLSFFIILLAFSLAFKNANVSFAETKEEERARLQLELAELERQIAEQEKIISTTQAKSATLSRDISLLQSQINKKQLEIKKIDNNINSLAGQISNKDAELGVLSKNLSKQKAALSNALRNMNSFDGIDSFLNLILGSQTISEFFQDADKITSLQDAVNRNLEALRNTTDQVNRVKEGLEEDKDTQLALRTAQRAEQQKIDANKAQKNTLLKETKGEEAVYQKQLAEKKAKAAQIRAALFDFAGGATKAIPFGDALAIAEQAEAKTGVSPAFVLAILTQESALGANVGKCYLSDRTSGAGYNVNTQAQYTNVMKASRDLEPFIKITESLGLDPLKTVVSCPIPSAGGYGGAMGPAQFIASTWQEVAPRIGSVNPWNAKDAIFASSQYLSDIGAANSYASQLKAACRYYGTGGATCSYGRSVMSKVDGIQKDIDYLKQYGG
ncbi:hypothetical protein SDC9_33251 [bioreactor metagenome]|uniref:Transglycosylase SLT domain-containing protein n=1 Tax=bioreactor metagenome TaxID=1076179 RepID=A0A644V7S3_9ZZZZ|nr:lytic murein transglycosylase [Candidatus Elulimicrobiales bacterium]